MVKAVSLVSGGLDSLLATRLVFEQGIHLEAVHFLNIFSSQQEKTVALLEDFTKRLGIKLKIFELDKEFLEVVRHPKYGYGSQMNPCIDCRIYMLKKAGSYMREIGASFLVTGEVLDERPMSQRRPIFELIEKESGLIGLILRPLSAGLLKPTVAEEKGWIIRERLLAIRGRSRKPQLKLAEEFEIKEYLWPSGGCLLTDPAFCRRLKDLFEHIKDCSVDEIRLLKLGRHFRLSKEAKLVVGRDEKENEALLRLVLEDDHIFCPLDVKGPIGLGRGNLTKEIIELCISILAYYCKREDNATPLKIIYKKKSSPDSEVQIKEAFPVSYLKIKELQI